MIHRSHFSATNHRGILLLKDTNIDLEYAKYTLEPIFRELKKGGKAIMERMSTHRYHHL